MSDKPQITDSHCHLDFPDFNDDLSEVINNALQNGVRRMVTICTRLKNEPLVRKISEDYKAVYYAAGNHPMSVSSEPMARPRPSSVVAEKVASGCGIVQV